MIRDVHPGSRIPDPDADFLPSRIPDPGVKKAPKPNVHSFTNLLRPRNSPAFGLVYEGANGQPR